MTVYMVVAAVIGSFFLAFAAVILLYGLGCAIGQAIADWRGFSADYDAAHRPQRLDVSNVRILPGTRDLHVVGTRGESA